MSSYRQKTKIVTVPAAALGVDGTARIWDDPASTPLKNLTVLMTGVFDATKVTYQMYLGGTFVNSANSSVRPYSADAVSIVGGVPHGGSDEVGSSDTNAAKLVSFGDVLFPMNNPARNDVALPFFVEFKNSAATAITVKVTFIAEVMGTTV